MALALNYTVEISDDGTTLSVTETTNSYAADNTGGWGSPNPSIASATSATITIEQLTDADIGTYADPVVIDVYDTLPNVDGTIFEITAEDAGYGTDAVFPDAVYRITYDVAGDSGGAYSATKEKSFVFTHVIDCAVKVAGNNVSICSCNCAPVIGWYNNIMIQKRLMDAATCDGTLVQIFNYITLITNMINNHNNCNC